MTCSYVKDVGYKTDTQTAFSYPFNGDKEDCCTYCSTIPRDPTHFFTWGVPEAPFTHSTCSCMTTIADTQSRPGAFSGSLSSGPPPPTWGCSQDYKCVQGNGWNDKGSM